MTNQKLTVPLAMAALLAASIAWGADDKPIDTTERLKQDEAQIVELKQQLARQSAAMTDAESVLARFELRMAALEAVYGGGATVTSMASSAQ